MKHRARKLTVLIVVWGTIAIAGFGSAIWQLWNMLMPALFHLPAIGFWQAVGLMALCWLLFGGWRGAGGLSSDNRHARRHLLTDEERDRLRASMARDCR
ncbi:MAG TPA: hypothetical protein VF774_27940 [Pseudoduganella sp.]